MQTVILIASPIVSVVSLALTYYLFRQTQRANIMPVLVFARTSTNRWQLANVGHGPALSIVVGDKAADGKWGYKVRCYPIAAGAQVPLDWLQYGDELVATYTDTRGNTYSSVCSMSENRLYQSNKFPDLVPTLDEFSLRAMREEYRGKF
jgi:hypothetical protein